MKLLYAFLLLTLSIVFIGQEAVAQIPNAGFESWSGDQPAGWVVANKGQLVTTVTPTTSAHSGSLALLGQVASLGVNIPPIGITGVINGLDTVKGFPCSIRPTAFTGYYNFTPAGGDKFQIYVAFQKNGKAIGAATFLTDQPQGSYKQFSVAPVWSSQDIPDTAYIAFEITNAAGPRSVNRNSKFTLDDLNFDTTTAGVTSASNPSTFALLQNYPNPFATSTTIAYTLSESGYTTLNVYDVTGKIILSLVRGEQVAGAHHAEFDASTLHNGIYFYRLTSGMHSESRQLQIIR